jgi:TonB family protein
VAVPATNAQDELARVRALYDAAAYEDALAAIPDPEAETDGRADLEQYRALCLVALGRPQEAVEAVERVVTHDPLFVPSSTDMSPRVQTLFAEARARLIPGLAKRAYSEARAALEAKDHAVAHAAFQRAIHLIESAPEAEQQTLGELRVLATEFLALTRVLTTTAVSAGTPSVMPHSPASVASDQAEEPVVQGHAAPIRQTLPAWVPSDAATRRTAYTGAIRITIGSDGRVESASLIRPSHPTYDAAILRAAKQWLYTPATRGGRAVTSHKDIEYRLIPQ